MSGQLRENRMAKPVADWLRAKGYIIYSEVPFGFSSPAVIDMVGQRGDDFAVVEMKISLTRGVIRQAHLGQLYTDNVWCAIASHPRSKNLDQCRQLGVGVLAVSGEIVTELVVPNPPRSIAYSPGTIYHTRMIEQLATMTPCDESGLPTLKGDGPAIRMMREVENFRAEHPNATWAQIYDSISDNHYSSPASFCGAMAMLKKRQRQQNLAPASAPVSGAKPTGQEDGLMRD